MQRAYFIFSWNAALWSKSVGILIFCLVMYNGHAQTIMVQNKTGEKEIVFGNDKLRLTLHYDFRAVITELTVNGAPVIQNQDGVFSVIRSRGATYSSRHLLKSPSVIATNSSVKLAGIIYGDSSVTITEDWTFHITPKDIFFEIARTTSGTLIAERLCSPVFTFNSIHTWEGAYQDYGGLAWFYLFNKPRDTYAVYSHESDFWNSQTGNGLTLSVAAPGKRVAMDYSRTENDQLAFTVGVSDSDMALRFDADTRRRRFVRDTSDVWAPITVPAGKSVEQIRLSYFNFQDKYGRGRLAGINQKEVSSVLNTIARIGVIGKDLFGGNSWHTPYGPICLHEQYIAQLGIGINDSNYLKGYQECLDYYRDNAIKPDGRVWPRWAYSNEDAMPKAFTDKGFYEAQWGYLFDSNPDFVTNVAELFDQTGNKEWLKGQQKACEKALDWIISRDRNGNGLVEMMTDSHTEKRGSDWIDIIWAAYENAFVNAKLYYALQKWIVLEKLLNNDAKGSEYASFAAKLKSSFNKPTTQGGFWDNDRKCYVHWRDKDGSVHGNNMVTPVNFMAIAYGICDDRNRTRVILDEIETQMEKEDLFFWPICLYSYAPGEGNDWQFPFPNYENGDIFLSWGSVGVKAYAGYKPQLAVKYIKHVLDRYAKDGLAFQRYGRAKQDGLGDDILAGNALAVVGLYQSIYGLNPLYNRFYLNPHITPELAGTTLRYNYRGQPLVISLGENQYAISNRQFKISDHADFGFFASASRLEYFNGNRSTASLSIEAASKEKLALTILSWTPAEVRFTQAFEKPDRVNRSYRLAGLVGNAVYVVLVNGKEFSRIAANADGGLAFDRHPEQLVESIVIRKRE